MKQSQRNESETPIKILNQKSNYQKETNTHLNHVLKKSFSKSLGSVSFFPNFFVPFPSTKKTKIKLTVFLSTSLCEPVCLISSHGTFTPIKAIIFTISIPGTSGDAVEAAKVLSKRCAPQRWQKSDVVEGCKIHCMLRNFFLKIGYWFLFRFCFFSVFKQ